MNGICRGVVGGKDVGPADGERFDVITYRVLRFVAG